MKGAHSSPAWLPVESHPSAVVAVNEAPCPLQSPNVSCLSHAGAAKGLCCSTHSDEVSAAENTNASLKARWRLLLALIAHSFSPVLLLSRNVHAPPSCRDLCSSLHSATATVSDQPGYRQQSKELSCLFPVISFRYFIFTSCFPWSNETHLLKLLHPLSHLLRNSWKKFSKTSLLLHRFAFSHLERAACSKQEGDSRMSFSWTKAWADFESFCEFSEAARSPGSQSIFSRFSGMQTLIEDGIV